MPSRVARIAPRRRPETRRAPAALALVHARPGLAAPDWRDGLPVLDGSRLLLRELRATDAPSLLRLLATEDVARYIAPPPTTVAQFERFIAWTHQQRRDGRGVGFAIVPEGGDTAVGFFQLRALDPAFTTAEWGFVLGAPFWGTGMFLEGAQLTLRFAFEEVGIWRLEARALAANGRGNGALLKVGAVQEGWLPQSFLKDGRLHDQTAWALLEPDWRRVNGVWRPDAAAHLHRPPCLVDGADQALAA
jgi:[ribosomal protein S5]-alanine N-acetyltransferase